jgi:O-antigen/teichoic acid export membrane protein
MPEGISVLPEQKRLDRALVRGIAWTGEMKWLTQLLSWAATLVVARLLSPADYRLVGMATVYLGLMGLVNEFGLGSAIVMKGGLSDEQVAQICRQSP